MAIKTLKEKYNNPIIKRIEARSGLAKYSTDIRSGINRFRSAQAQAENFIADAKDLLGLNKDGISAPGKKTTPPTINMWSFGDPTAVSMDANNQCTVMQTKDIKIKETLTAERASDNSELGQFRNVHKSDLLVTNILPVPTTIEVDTAIDWASEEAGVLGANIINNDVTLGQIENIGLEKLGNQYAAKAGENIKKSLIEGVTGGDGAFKALQRQTGEIINPRNSVFFGGVKQREFSMEWNLAPVNEAQVKLLMTFLKALHYHALPATDNEEGTLKYPSIFDVKIQDVNAGGPTGTLLDFGYCAIKNINANYTPDGVWASYEGGNPVRLLLKCDFIQIELPTKDKVDKLFTHIEGQS